MHLRRPRFGAVRYGHPAYAQLHRTCAPELRTGASNGAEMGAFNHLLQAQREANLRTRLDEYLPFGLEAGIVDVGDKTETVPAAMAAVGVEVIATKDFALDVRLRGGTGLGLAICRKLADALGSLKEQASGHWCSSCKGIWFGTLLETECPVCGNRNG